MKLFFAILALFSTLVSAPPASAGDLTVSRAVLEDTTGTLSINDMAGREFTPIGPTLSKGFTGSVYWLRLKVRAPAQNSQVVLLIREPFLNEVRLYEADAGNPSGWKSRVTGNYYPYKERERHRNTLGFVVNITSPEETFYLRLKTTTHSQLSVEALTPDEAEHADYQLDLLEIFFVTSMGLLLLWALHSYFLDRLPVVGLFAIHQFMYTLFGVAITGYLAPYIPSGFPRLADLSTAVPYCGVSFTILLFCRELFKPYEPPPLLMRGLNLSLLVFPLQLTAIALGYTPVAVMTNGILLELSWWYLILMAFTLRKEQSPSRRMLQLFFVIIAIIFTLFWLAGTFPEVAKNILFGRQVLIANGIIIGGIFAMILNGRSRRLLLEAQQFALESKTKSEFLALVSHEIRTPLSAIVGFSSLVRSATDPVKINQYHAILEQSSHSLMELVNDILDMSKIEADRMEVDAIPFNLRRLVGNLVEQYRPLAAQKKLSFQASIGDNVPLWVIGDPLRLRQVLANLLANAVKFTDSGEISCSVTMIDKQPARIRFDIRDTGIGIPESGRDRLFHPFGQLDPTITRTYGGTGLGLAIVNSLVEMMNGSITVESREGEGSCFAVELPLQKTDAVPEILTSATVMSAGTILVVEDNDFNRRLLGDILISWGQQVIFAENGWLALQFIEQQRFDLVLLDIRMPDIDGIEVARRIRVMEQANAKTAVPIIAITADADAATREACLAVGINAVLAKPVIPEQLARAIAAYYGEIAAAPPGKEELLNEQTSIDLGQNPERARMFRELLIKDIDDELRLLHVALECDDRNDLGRVAHTLKGLCSHLENQESSNLATWLQQNALSAQPEQLRRMVEQLCQCNTYNEEESQ